MPHARNNMNANEKKATTNNRCFFESIVIAEEHKKMFDEQN